MDAVIVVAVITLLIAINGFYVAAEFSTVSAQRSRLSQMADEENIGAQRMLNVVEDAHKLDVYIAACQLGITLSSLVLGSYGQSHLAAWVEPYVSQLGGSAQLVAQSLSATVILVLLTMLQVVLGELMPKNVGLRYPERVAILTEPLMTLSVRFFQPLIWLFNGSGQLILRLFGMNAVAEHAHIHSPEEIVLMVEESSAGGVLDREERRLLVNTLQLRNVNARRAMLPRNRMLAAPVETPCSELFHLLAESPYSRLPLYGETIDEIVGIVHLRDLIIGHTLGSQVNGDQMNGDQAHVRSVPTAREMMHGVEFVPDSMSIEDVMARMQAAHTNVAIVVDEYGGTAGMITFEDLIEEIIGEFEDEFDAENPSLRVEGNNRLRVRGDVLIDDLNDLMTIFLPTDEVDTIGGLVTSTLGRIPTPGEEVTLDGITLRVEKMEQNSVIEVSLPISPQQIAKWDAETS